MSRLSTRIGALEAQTLGAMGDISDVVMHVTADGVRELTRAEWQEYKRLHPGRKGITITTCEWEVLSDEPIGTG